MPLNACIIDECSFMPAPGSVFCPGHHAEAMGKSAGVIEPELEARAARVRTEDDMHPGQRKVYCAEGCDGDHCPGHWVEIPAGGTGGQSGDEVPPVLSLSLPKGTGTSLPPEHAEALKVHVPTWDERVGVSPELRARIEAEFDERPSGVWVAYHIDWSGFVFFEDEVSALRHGVANMMSVKFVKYGEDPRG